MASDAAAAAQRFPRPPTPAAPPGDSWPHPADPAGAVTPQSAPAPPAAPVRATWTSPQPAAAATPSPAAPAPRRHDGPRATWDNARYALWIRPALLALVVLLALAIGVGAYLLLQQPR